MPSKTLCRITEGLDTQKSGECNGTRSAKFRMCTVYVSSQLSIYVRVVHSARSAIVLGGGG